MIPDSAPAPWSLRGGAYSFLLHTPFSRTPIPLPPGAYHPDDAPTPSSSSSTFHGGLGVVMLVRYTESPVGPYDELLYIPGYFERKDTPGVYKLAITRIYVSSRESVFNGRVNWGIPKHRAKFTFTSTSRRTEVAVSTPTSPTPFFRAYIHHPWTLSVPLPISTSHFPYLSWLTQNFKFELSQPRLSASSESGSGTSGSTTTAEDKETLVGSEAAYLVRPTADGWGKIVSIEKVEEESESGQKVWEAFGDGIEFPKFVPLLKGRGVQLMEFKMTFGVPEVIG